MRIDFKVFDQGFFVRFSKTFKCIGPVIVAAAAADTRYHSTAVAAVHSAVIASPANLALSLQI